MAATAERQIAIAAADATCPRCGTARAPRDRYCLACGLKLPVVAGAVPALRRRWLRRLGWYPGDWVWLSLASLVVAVGGAAAAIAVTTRDNKPKPVVFTAPGQVAVGEPSSGITVRPRSTVPARKLPKAPEPTVLAKRVSWPANENGWTIVLVSYPKISGVATARATVDRAVKSNLRRVGILDSGNYASLQPGYFVVFTGIYASKVDADAAVGTVKQAGFGGAYSRQIAR
jgi:hypothetical protein